MPSMPISPEHAYSEPTAHLLPPLRNRRPKAKRKPCAPLTAKQTKFIELLVTGLDRVSAYEQAGYSGKHLAVHAWKLEHNPKIQAALSQRAQDAIKAAAIDSTYVIEGIKDEIEYLKAKEQRSASDSQAILRGHELLGKTIALFRDRTEEDRQITVTIQRIG